MICLDRRETIDEVRAVAMSCAVTKREEWIERPNCRLCFLRRVDTLRFVDDDDGACMRDELKRFEVRSLELVCRFVDSIARLVEGIDRHQENLDRFRCREV